MPDLDTRIATMRVVRFEHQRCSEYDGTEYLLVPADWSEERIRREADVAQDELTEDAKAVKASPLNPPRYPDFTAHPDKTVAEVQTLHAEQKAAYKAWLAANQKLTRSFSDRLRERGFVGLWEQHADVLKVGRYWGHNHGLTLNYKHAEWPDE